MRALHAYVAGVVVTTVSACASGGAPRTTTCPTAAPAKKFEMRTYTFVLLKRGPAWTPEKSPETEKLFKGHMANIIAMHDAGKLVLAGPLEMPGNDADPLSGIFVLDVKSDDEAKALLAKDPAIAAGRLAVELRQWYGPVGITYDGRDQVTSPTP